jgi:hypothetical protein
MIFTFWRDGTLMTQILLIDADFEGDSSEMER